MHQKIKLFYLDFTQRQNPVPNPATHFDGLDRLVDYVFQYFQILGVKRGDLSILVSGVVASSPTSYL